MAAKSLRRRLRLLSFRLLLVLFFLVLFFFVLFCRPAQAQERPHIIVILCGALTCDDIHDNRYPHLFELAETGSVGLMNCAVSGARTPTSAELALALGQHLPSHTEDVFAFNVAERVPGTSSNAENLFRRNTGAPPPTGHGIVLPSIGSMVQRKINDVTLGAALAGATPAVRAVVCGNEDAAAIDRGGALFVLDAKGTGIGDVTLGQNDGTRPFSRADANMVTLSRYAATADADLFVLQLGDLPRAEAARSHLSMQAYQTARSRALERLDTLLYLLNVALADTTTRIDVLLLSPFPPVSAPVNYPFWTHTTPVLAFGPDFPAGLLTSPTTRTPGLIANSDVAPTLLALLHVPRPPSMIGRPFRSVPGSTGAVRVAALTRIDYVAALNARAQVYVAPVLGGICLLIGVIGLAVRKRLGTRVARWFAPNLICALNLPTAFLLSPILIPPTLLEYALRIVAWMIALTILSYLLARPLHMQPPVSTSFVCILLVVVDTLTGQTLQRDSMLSSYTLSGIRYYGVGNEILGVLLAFALIGGFSWLDDRQIPFKTPVRNSRTCLILIGLWTLLMLLLGWPRLGANSGSLVVNSAGFGSGLAVLRGGRPTIKLTLCCVVIGLTLAFAFSALDTALGHGASSHAGEAISAAAHGRGVGYLVHIALRKLALNLSLFIEPWLLLAAGAIVASIFAARALLGGIVQQLLARRIWTSRGLVALFSALAAALVFKDTGLVTSIYMIGATSIIILWYALCSG